MKEKNENKQKGKKGKSKLSPLSGKGVFFEITMYKLLVIILIGWAICFVAGLYFGNFIGKANAVDNLQIEVPEYCTYDKSVSSLEIKCNEISNTTATELCGMLSTPLKDKLKVLVVT